MSQTPTNVETSIGIRTVEETYTVAVNKSIESMVKYINLRGLSMETLTSIKDSLEDGLFQWMAGRHLQQIMIEVYDPSSGELIERLDLEFEIEDPEDLDSETEERMRNKDFEYYGNKMIEAISKHDAPPEEAEYRILAGVSQNDIDQDPPPVDGWTEATPMDDSHLSKEEYGDHLNTGNIDSQFEFWF